MMSKKLGIVRKSDLGIKTCGVNAALEREAWITPTVYIKH